MRNNSDNHYASLLDVHESIDTTQPKKRWKRLAAFIGPAYLVSVGYMDPGNWATDLQGGSKFGYKLIWVLLMSNLMALLLQSLAARLGIVRRRDLAQANREAYPKSINLILYVLAEIAIAATDLAEVLGMAIGLHLLTGIPILWGVLITVLDTFLLLILQRLGMRKMEAFIVMLIAIIGISFLIEIIFAQPNFHEIARGFVPTIPNSEALYISIGIIGATVMPHNLYLHSALVQTRKITRDEPSIRRAIRFNIFDSAIALNLAFFVNAAILILAAAVFFKTGRTDVAEIKEAHKMLEPMLGTSLAPILFAVALIAAGQSSTVTGTLAGQIVMEGYLRLRINPWLRRVITRLLAIIPAVIVILIYGENELDDLLVFSQVILSIQLGFAIIPLIHFVSDKEKMGVFVIPLYVKILAWLVTFVLLALNLKMVFEQSIEYLQSSHNNVSNFFVIAGLVVLVSLLATVLLFPFIRRRMEKPITIHAQNTGFKKIDVPAFKRIAVALDFGAHDSKILSFAIAQGNPNTTFILIHVVESVSAQMLGEGSADYESLTDQEQLDLYVAQIKENGFNAIAQLGFERRTKEIVRIVKEQSADLLVMGAHGHTGFKDWLYGETINNVRHELKIPVLLINV
ncbi:Nramp family divalent metal transporter [Pinibacter aurantiacus]|uniref:Divalent metal cation transporter MntH n=1 Tax=Pinibacter aurantiacus TaxID=2851599 RepID=A0A9E2W630_9BACT|nr:Nramp family divalent metal transporter [Pinibacter aurantiacus]MBV4359599.1 Nramp family divalent metal transporter [Pinibacter aurantiacus]